MLYAEENNMCRLYKDAVMASSESLISLTLKSRGLYSHTVQLSIALTLTIN